MWFSVLVLAALGFWIAGPFGAGLGAFVGACLEVSKRSALAFSAGQRRANFQQPAEAQSAFFKATFVVMGKLAKADGRVTQDEILLASRLMDEMRLSADMRKQAIEYFRQGKDNEIPIDEVLENFRLKARSASLIQMFLELQVQAAYADGVLTQSELNLLQSVCQHLGVSPLSFRVLLSRFEAQRAFFQYSQHQQGAHQQHRYQAAPRQDDVQKAYAVLGVEMGADRAVVKRAYRKLMSQHHPDKLVAKGLPEEMMEVAKQKTQQIQAAYDVICKHQKGR